MKRIFTLGTASDRKTVVVEVDGSRMTMTQKKSDGSTKRKEKILGSESAARTALEGVVVELARQGFVERKAATKVTAKPAGKEAVSDGLGVNDLYDEAGSAREAAPLLPRIAAPAAEAAPKKKKAGVKKKRGNPQNGDALDKRVLAGIGVVGAVLVAFAGYFVFDVFLKPSTIVGAWAGSNIDFEIGKPMIHSSYRLVLDNKNRASMTREEKFTSTGTYTLQGDRLKLNLKEESDEGGKDEPGESSEQHYRVVIGRATLDLFDPDSGKRVVQLIRFREEPVVGGKAPRPEAPAEVAAGVPDLVDKDADARLVSVEFSPKDNAFKLRHPKGWETETGSRPDNTYSWVTATKGSAKVQVFADVQGSLMSGSDSAGRHEEGSEFAPVHRAHELYRKTASEQYSDYTESKPALFKGAGLGEGRIASFTASGGGLFGAKIKGYRVTLLTNDRRVTTLCECPDGDFEKLKPTFLALCRSLSR